MTEISANSPKKWRVPFAIHLQGRPNNQMAIRVDDWSASLSSNESYSNTVVPTYDANVPNVPISKWVHIEVFYKFGDLTNVVNNRGQGTGQVIVFQDGKEIYRFDNTATKPQSGANSYNWVVTSYAYKPNPAEFHFYVDDAAISTVRLGGARELAKSGDFSDSTKWRIDVASQGTYSVIANGGLSANSPVAAQLTITNPVSGNINKPAFHQTQKIEGGIRLDIPYTLRFTAKANITRTIRALIQHNFYPVACCGGDNDANYSEYWNSGDINLTTAPLNFVYVLTPTATITPWATANSIIVFKVGSVSSTVWIDNVSLVQSPNLILNGDFDQSSAWVLDPGGSNSSYATVANGGLSANNATAGKVTITSTGSQLYQPELHQTLVNSLDAGVTYTLRFTAKSGFDRTMQVAIHDVSDGAPTPFWWESFCPTINLTADAQNFSCSFQPGEASSLPTSTLSIGFLLGNVSGNNGVAYDVVIDNVSLSRSQ